MQKQEDGGITKPDKDVEAPIDVFRGVRIHGVTHDENNDKGDDHPRQSYFRFCLHDDVLLNEAKRS